MKFKLFLSVFIVLFLITTAPLKAQTAPGDLICGKWTTVEKNLTVEVYKEGGEYKGKTVWFKNDDNSKTMEEWTDKNNPDKTLRNRKLLGLIVVKDLIYQPKTNTWEHGSIYDAKSGKYWDAAATITKDGLLKVTGYWHFKFIGRAMVFKKVS